MVRFICILFYVCFVMTVPAGAAPLKLEIAPGGWGRASTADVERLLQNTASHLTRYFPDHNLPTIYVEPRGGPVVLFQRRAGGEIAMHLNTGDLYWAQYAFQFGHELCHVLARYDDDPTGNRWFEESICELSSLFVLRRMGETWNTAAPYRNWAGYSQALTNYAAERIDQYTPAGDISFDAWYRKHAESLGADAYNRDLNTVVAVRLLPLFEAEPENWSAVQYLNNGAPDRSQSFEDYMKDWHRNVPANHRAFVRRIASEFGLEILPG